MNQADEDFRISEEYKCYLRSRPKEEVLAEIAEHFIKVMELDPEGIFASDFRSFVAEGQVEDFIEDYTRSKASEGNLRSDPGFVEFLREIRV